jgi:hypothetical protein
VNLSEIEQAAADWQRAAELERQARALKDKAGPVLDKAGVGTHGRVTYSETAGRSALNEAAAKAFYAEHGAAPVMRNVRGSRRFVWTA